MTVYRRWDIDERGEGIASGAPFADSVRLLADEMSQGMWVAEKPEWYLYPNLMEAVEKPGSPCRMTSTTFDPNGRYIIDLQWTGNEGPSYKQLRAAIFELIGAIAETATYVRELSDRDFEVITGVLSGGDFAPHGHVLLLRIAVERQDSPSP